jgi:hypothetical protein
MSPRQYDRLPLETYATSAHQKLYVLNARTSFQANSNDTATATNNNQLILNCCDGLEAKWPGVVCTYSVDASAPVVPIAVNIPTYAQFTTELNNNLSGSANRSNTYLPAVLSQPVENEYYYAFNLTSNEETNGGVAKTGYPYLGNMYHKIFILTMQILRCLKTILILV